jgi:predicted N-acetyltransferase YhbS
MVPPVGFTWKLLEGDDQIPFFMDATVALYRPVFDRLTPEDRPFFFDYWLRLFNTSSTYVAMIDGVPQAMVTQPRGSGAHQYRWETATLACSDAITGQLVLPEEIDREQSFRMSGFEPVQGVRSPVLNTEAVEKQRGYVCSLLDLGFDPGNGSPWRIRRLARADFEETLDLLKRSYATEKDPDPDLSEPREELRQIIDNDAGWCWVASPADESNVCGVVSYTAMHVPNAGVPAALVSDLAVDPAHRRQGLARFMQRQAYARLREFGQRWVFGNIDPENHASCRQAESLERTIWYRCVVFRTAEV